MGIDPTISNLGLGQLMRDLTKHHGRCDTNFMFGLVWKWPWLHGSWNPKNPDLLPSVYHDQVTAVGQMGNSTFGQIQYKHQSIGIWNQLRVMYWNGEMSGPSFLLCQIITWSLIQSRPTNQTPRWRLLICIPNWDGGRQIPIWPGPFNQPEWFNPLYSYRF